MSEARVDKFEDVKTGDPVVVKFERGLAMEELIKLAESMSEFLEYLDKVGQPMTDLDGDKVLSIIIDPCTRKIFTSSV